MSQKVLRSFNTSAETSSPAARRGRTSSTRLAAVALALGALLLGPRSLADSGALQSEEPTAAPESQAQPGAAGSAAEDSRHPDPDWYLCAQHTRAIERSQDLPPFLLTAMSKVESGRWHHETGEVMAWPWTVTSVEGGKYFPTKASALREVRRLQDLGIVSIDVGCMQINLLYHPEAFEDLEAAFDPALNVAYAADFLIDLRQQYRSWTGAISRYHSATPQFSGGYRLKVMRAWREERRRPYEAKSGKTGLPG